jgi:hypothetical protein
MDQRQLNQQADQVQQILFECGISALVVGGDVYREAIWYRINGPRASDEQLRAACRKIKDFFQRAAIVAEDEHGIFFSVTRLDLTQPAGVAWVIDGVMP